MLAKSFCALLIGLCLATILGPSAAAHQIALKTGRVIQFEKYQVTESLLLYTDDAGKQIKIALNEIDLDRTRELSASDNPPLDLPGLIIPSRLQTNTATQSVADVARKNRSKDAPPTPKRVWTTDDFASAAETESAASPETYKRSASETLQQFRLLSKEALGAAVLKGANAPDIQFPERRDWEQKLFDAKQAWMDQIDRMEEHKNSSKDALDAEIALAQGAQRNFDRISAEGIQQARAVNDPTLRAHLEYQRQQTFCNQTTGNMLSMCLASLDQLKWKMQREGTW